MDSAVGSEGAEGITLGCDINPAAYRMQPCNLPLAYVQARQWNDDRNFENVLAYSTAHELSRTPFPPKPWQLEQTRPGAIKASGSLSFLSKRIGSPHRAKPSVLCSLRS